MRTLVHTSLLHVRTCLGRGGEERKVWVCYEPLSHRRTWLAYPLSQFVFSSSFVYSYRLTCPIGSRDMVPRAHKSLFI